MLTRIIALAALLLSCLLLVRDARAEAPGPRAYPLYVLAIDTDEAEDQAEALIGAVRSRVRTLPGYSLADTNVTLSMLTAALKCPRLPDATCLGKISEQLKAERFIWGTIQKAPNSMVKVDLHLWARNKPEQHVSETYADNLKDQNDERLGRVAQHLLERLTGVTTSGALIVHAGDGAGVVFVDGQRRGMLEKGEGSFEVPAGNHVVEVRIQGLAPTRDSVNIIAGKETRLNVTLPTVEGAGAPPEPASSGSGRKVGGWAAVAVGGALLIASGVEGLVWLSKKSDQDKIDTTQWSGDPCKPQHVVGDGATAREACQRSDDARKVSTLAIAFGATGAVAVAIGLYLVLSDPGTPATSPKFEDRVAKQSAGVRLLPAVSPSSQGVILQGAF
jgi:hypothetical protein